MSVVQIRFGSVECVFQSLCGRLFVHFLGVQFRCNSLKPGNPDPGVPVSYLRVPVGKGQGLYERGPRGVAG